MAGRFFKRLVRLFSSSFAQGAEDGQVQVEILHSPQGFEARARFSFPCITPRCKGRIFGLALLSGFTPPRATDLFRIVEAPVKEMPACRRCASTIKMPLSELNARIREATYWAACEKELNPLPQEDEEKRGVISKADISAPRRSDLF